MEVNTGKYLIYQTSKHPLVALRRYMYVIMICYVYKCGRSWLLRDKKTKLIFMHSGILD